MIKKHWGLIAVSAFALAACDVVRVPGDGREPPQPGPVVPDGAPGPPPPTVPVKSASLSDGSNPVVSNRDVEKA